MAEDKKVETRLLAVTTTCKTVDFGNPPINHMYFHSDTDDKVQVDFDQPCDNSSFLLGKEPVEIDVRCNKLYVQTTDGTANLYILAIR